MQIFANSQAHGGAECPEFVGWALAHKGKASKVTYNLDNPPSASSNPSVYTRINAYTEAGRQVHGPEWDPSAHPLDGEIIMRVGGGKKHGRYYIGDDTLDTAQLAAQVAAYEAKLAKERRQREEWEARQQAEMTNLFSYIRGLSVQMGQPPPPPMMLPLTPAPGTPHNQSTVASNTPKASPGISPTFPAQQLFPPGGPLPFNAPQ
ncbi:uncharacterized protein C2845_PM15G02750 [Panicum miliaceum]|uniref:Uncharacterized protein n=1 Tax=Panicum miliaceum TaxID=4540 RepID=A0A3L6QEL9_PANMI|nr:uncharacterized protein C2845_PM15G02750 [Panicum miliaceum]